MLYAYAASQLMYLRFRRALPDARPVAKLHDPPALAANPGKSYVYMLCTYVVDRETGHRRGSRAIGIERSQRAARYPSEFHPIQSSACGVCCFHCMERRHSSW